MQRLRISLFSPRPLAGVWLAFLVVSGAFAAPCGASPLQGDTVPTGSQAGGEYTGPGDTVPGTTGGGTNTGGGPVSTGPLGPGGPVGPSAPAGPTGGGPSTLPPPIPPGLPDSPLEPPGPQSPGGRPRVHSTTSWQMWWHYNRWTYVDPRSGEDLLATSSVDAFYLGRGTRPESRAVRRATTAQRSELLLPALSDALRAGGRAELRIALSHALAKLREAPGPDSNLPTFDEALEPLLQSGNPLVTEKALLFLGLHGTRQAFVPLATILQDLPEAKLITRATRTGWRWRAFAAYALGLLGERNADDTALVARVFRTLVRAYPKEANDEVRIAIGCAAARLGLPHRSQTSDSEAQAMERREQIQALLSLYRNEEETDVRAQLAPALALLASDARTFLRAPVIEELLKPLTRRSRAAAHWQAGCVLGLALVACAGEGDLDQKARSELARLAFKSGTPRGVRFLARVGLAQVLARAGDGPDPWAGIDAARKLLVRALARERGEGLGWTALAVGLLERSAFDRGQTPDAQAMRVLRQAVLTERSPDAAPAIALALGLAGDQEAVPLLRKRFAQASSPDQRGYFALAVGLSGAQDARSQLHEELLVSQNQPFALEQISLALAMLGDSSAGEPLVELLSEASDPAVQASLASSIGWSRAPAVLERLIERVSNRRLGDLQRAWSAVAIGRIVDEDRWPWTGSWSRGTNYTHDVTTRIEPDYRTGLLDLW